MDVETPNARMRWGESGSEEGFTMKHEKTADFGEAMGEIEQ